MDGAEDKRCKNCGSVAVSKFCPECGQSTVVAIPSLLGLTQEVFAAVLSYDSRFLRTLRVLVFQPGQLTADYLDGVRARYIPPFQLFVWLEAATFLVNRLMFDTNQKVSDLKSRDLLFVGVGVAVTLSLMNAFRRRKVIDNVLFATHLWSFLMVVLLVEYAVLPLVNLATGQLWPQFHLYVGYTATIVALVAMLGYTPPALRRVFGDRLWVAILRSLVLVGVFYCLELLFERYLHPGVRV